SGKLRFPGRQRTKSFVWRRNRVSQSGVPKREFGNEGKICNLQFAIESSMKWFLGVILLLFAALVLESGLLAYAMYVLLGVLVLSRVLARSWTENLTATRECRQATAEVGDSVSVTVTVRNTGTLPVPWVLLEDMLPAKALMASRSPLKLKKNHLKIAMIRS